MLALNATVEAAHAAEAGRGFAIVANEVKELAKETAKANADISRKIEALHTDTKTATEIGQVVEVISLIARQTNLLALNARIEAGRAGDAGQKFAVVADDVKELAKETAKATDEVSRKIEGIQTSTKAAIEALASLGGVVNQVKDISNTIATAVVEQNATANETSRNVIEAARSSHEISSNIAGVAEAAQGTTRGAADTLNCAAISGDVQPTRQLSGPVQNQHQC